MRTVFIDTETYSEHGGPADLGTWRYTEFCELMVVTWLSAEDREAQVWDLTASSKMPKGLAALLKADDTIFIAHNAPFDRGVLTHHGGLFNRIDGPRRWRCSRAKAYTMSLPGSLDALSKLFKLGDGGKMQEGKKLIQRFCKPAPKNHKVDRYTRETHPEEWQQFLDYAQRDTEALARIWNQIPSVNYAGAELELWFLDQKINDRGLPIDTRAVRAVTRMLEHENEKVLDELKELTKYEIKTPGQTEAIRQYLREHFDLVLPNLQAATIVEVLQGDLPPVARRILEIRKSAGKAAVKKYAALLSATSDDGRIRHVFQYCGGSRTGRWSGQKFQPQNLYRPTIKQIDLAVEIILSDPLDVGYYYDDVFEVAASTVRAMVTAPEGRQLVVADYANIEGRILAWLAGEKWKVKAFRDYDEGAGDDLYKLAYARAFSVPVHSVDDDQRTIGKVQELALGFQGAVGAFTSMGRIYGVDFSEEQALEIVQAWRKTNPKIAQLWWDVDEAAKRAINKPGATYSVGMLKFRSVKKSLLMRLPSGHVIQYQRAVIDPDGQIAYFGSYSGSWTRLHTYGGKLVENAVQSTSRHLLGSALPRVEAAGFCIVGHVHDEIITEVDVNSRDLTTERLEQEMCVLPTWANGLPVSAAGYTTKRYRK